MKGMLVGPFVGPLFSFLALIYCDTGANGQSCGPVRQVLNAIAKSSETSVGTLVLYDCLENYQHGGRRRKNKCKRDMTWTDNVECIYNSTEGCSRMLRPDYTALSITTTVIHSAYPVGTVGQLKCRGGYYPSDRTNQNPDITCYAKGSGYEWRGRAMELKCLPVRCPRIYDLINGKVIGNSFTLGKQVEFECDPGYRRDGMGRSTCLADRTWSQRKPTCTRVCCNSLPRTRGLVSRGNCANDIATMQCDEGNMIENTNAATTSSDIVCQMNGQWSGSLATCVAMQCAKDLHIPNSKIEYSGTKFADMARITCTPGSKRTSCSNIVSDFCLAICETTGRFEVDVTCSSQCTEIRYANTKCRDDSSLQSFDHGTAKHFRCCSGYIIWPLNSSPSVTCDNGAWGISCVPENNTPAPATPCYIRGEHTGTSYVGDDNKSYGMSDMVLHGVTVRSSCIQGFNNINLSTAKCDHGVWSDNLPDCERNRCPLDTHMGTSYEKNAMPITENYAEYEDDVSLVCSPGNTHRDVQFRCNADKSFNPPLEACVEAPCYIRGEHTGTSYVGDDNKSYGMSDMVLHGVTVRSSCIQGFNNINLATAKCDHGIWSDNLPDCERNRCSLDTHMGTSYEKNAMPITENYAEYEDDVSLVCSPGYTHRDLQFRCNADKSFNPPLEACVEAPCNIGGEHTGTSYVGDDNMSYGMSDMVLHGVTVRTSCIPGFNNINLPTAKCDQGVWSDNLPDCERNRCSLGNLPEGTTYKKNGTTILNGYVTYEDVVTLECTPGYMHRGSSQSSCEADKSFRPPLETCVEGAAPCYIGGEHTGTSYVGDDNKSYGMSDMVLHGVTVRATCIPGFNNINLPTAKCDQGVWSDNLPVCERNRCYVGNLTEGTTYKKNGTTISNGYVTYEEVVTLECTPGYMYSRSTQSSCEADKSFRPPLETCVEEPCKLEKHRGTSYVGEDNIHYPAFSPVPHGIAVHANCRQGFNNVNLGTARCDRGKLLSDLPVCKRNRCSLDTHMGTTYKKNGMPITENYAEYEDDVTLECRLGYTHRGLQSRCNAYKSFNPPLEACVEVFCYPPKVMGVNLNPVKEKYHHDDWPTFSCAVGFWHKDAPPKSRCYDGDWKPPLVECYENCQLPAEATGRTYKKNGLQYDYIQYIQYEEKVTMECSSGYAWEVSESTCGPNGNLEPALQPCKKVYCLAPTENRILKPDKGRYEHEDNVTLECAAGFGYKVESTMTTVCNNRSWTPPMFECKALCDVKKLGTIPKTFEPKNSPLKDVYKHEEDIVLQCPEGYEYPSGKKELGIYTCLDGGWKQKSKSQCTKKGFSIGQHWYFIVFPSLAIVIAICISTVFLVKKWRD